MSISSRIIEHYEFKLLKLDIQMYRWRLDQDSIINNTSDDMDDKKRISGTALIAELYKFLKNNKKLINQLKISSQSSVNAKVTIIRCHAFEEFLKLLEEKMFSAKWSNQHDAIKIFLNVVLLGGDLSQLEKMNPHNVLIDILNETESYEIKTRQALTFTEIPSFIKDYYDEMIQYRDEKSVWWLIFFQKRDDQKDILGDVCIYYLVLIELHAREFKSGNMELDSITREVMDLVQKLKRKVAEEDDIKKGIFAPVDNYLIVEKLRSDRDKAVKRAKLIEEKLQAKLDQAEEDKIKLERENQLLKEKLKELEKK